MSPTPILFRCALAAALLTSAVPAAGQQPSELSLAAGLAQARAARAQADYRAAKAALDRVAVPQRNDFQYQYNLGLVQAGLNQYKEATEAFEAAQRLRDQQHIADFTIDNTLGWAYLVQGNYAAAIRELERAEQNLDRLPLVSRGRTLNNLGLAYSYSGQPEKAAAKLRAAEALGNVNAKQNLSSVKQ